MANLHILVDLNNNPRLYSFIRNVHFGETTFFHRRAIVLIRNKKTCNSDLAISTFNLFNLETTSDKVWSVPNLPSKGGLKNVLMSCHNLVFRSSSRSFFQTCILSRVHRSVSQIRKMHASGI